MCRGTVLLGKISCLGAVGDDRVVAVKNLVPEGDRTLLTLTYFHLSGAGHKVLSESAILTHWCRDALAAAGENAGFRVQVFHGGYDGSEFAPETSGDVLGILIKDTSPHGP